MAQSLNSQVFWQSQGPPKPKMLGDLEGNLLALFFFCKKVLTINRFVMLEAEITAFYDCEKGNLSLEISISRNYIIHVSSK